MFILTKDVSKARMSVLGYANNMDRENARDKKKYLYPFNGTDLEFKFLLIGQKMLECWFVHIKQCIRHGQLNIRQKFFTFCKYETTQELIVSNNTSHQLSLAEA